MKRKILINLSLNLLIMATLMLGGLAGNVVPVSAETESLRYDIVGPAGSGQFGKRVFALPNGNIVVTDPLYDSGATTDVGAVYLYNGATRELISTLTGSTTNDQVGIGKVVAVGNSNFVVCSPRWNNGGGAASAGAATWGNGTTGIAGVVSASNSLVGSTANDQVCIDTIPLANGNYAVVSLLWNNGGSLAQAGAVTWGDGTTGVAGVVSAGNSLVGSTTDALVGIIVKALTNGNYVVGSPLWDDGGTLDVGAATWGDGTTGITGAVSGANSLVGSVTGDLVGASVLALTNGNYVVLSPNWDNVLVTDAGAATWGDGTTGIIGTIDASNSLVGSLTGDGVGIISYALTNGNYVVNSPIWDNVLVTDAGAATWGNGTTGVTGLVSAANSLVGSTTGNLVGTSLTPLTNGNYVVGSYLWDDGGTTDVGAATWGDGTLGTFGPVGAANSLIGSTTGDQVGMSITALANGNYVVNSQLWDDVVTVNAGAATWRDGATGTPFETVSSGNSLVGSTTDDRVGISTRALSNGNYVVGSPFWDDGGTLNAGAATWGDGTTGETGLVSAANSLVGSTADDRVGGAALALTNGNYVVPSINWSNAGATRAGAVTWGDGTTGIVGTVDASNSLLGSTADDMVGGIVQVLADGHYYVFSPVWDDGGVIDAGAVTWGNGRTGIAGTVTAGNSVKGTATGGGPIMANSYDYTNNQLVIGRPSDNIVTLLKPYFKNNHPLVFN